MPLIQALVQAGADPNLCREDNGSPLLLLSEWGDASEARQLENVQWLIQVGRANPLVRGATGRSILHSACARKNVALVCWILDHCGASVFSTDNRGFHALHYACAKPPADDRGDPAGLVIELLRRHPNLKDIASPESPLLAAARWNPELCRLLADSYNFDVVDWEQPGDATALHVATHRGTEETTATLIELMKARGLNLDVTDVYSCTPLHYAVMAGCPAKMRLLLEGGCDVNKMDKRGVTPLAYAAVIRDAQNNESYRTDIVNDIRLITEHASKSNFVDLSVQRGASAELFDLLINHGANVRCDRHALLLAAAVGSLDATFLTIRAAATQGLFGDLSKTKEQGKLRSLTVKRKHPMRTRSSKRLCQEPPVAGKERP